MKAICHSCLRAVCHIPTSDLSVVCHTTDNTLHNSLRVYCHCLNLTLLPVAAFIAWAEYTGECDYNASDDAYCCEAESDQDYAQEIVEDNSLSNEVPEHLRSYLDFETYA